MNVKVSIIIPVYNGGNYLSEAIDSALAQDYSNIEVIVVNDGSNDNNLTESIAKSYGDKIKYLYKSNGGVATALNLAIKEMNGDYFSWLSHDDLYYPNKISAQIGVLSGLPDKEKVILYSNFDLINETSQVIGKSDAIVEPSFFRYWITTQSCLHGCSLLIPKRAFIKFGEFSTDLKTTQDYDMWFRMGSEYKFIGLDACLISGRIHPGQTTNLFKNIVIEECNLLRCRFIAEINKYEIPNYSKYSYLIIGDGYSRSQFYLSAFSAYKKAYLVMPIWAKPIAFFKIKIVLRKIKKIHPFLKKYLEK
jgi:glycosyltransferase involved in cell wall biosynthesis